MKMDTEETTNNTALPSSKLTDGFCTLEKGTFIGCAIPPSHLSRRGPYDRDFHVLTQDEQDQFDLIGLPVSIEHNWGLDKTGKMDVSDPTVREYNPNRGGQPFTGDIKVGTIVDSWKAADGSIMVKCRLDLNHPEYRIRAFARAAHQRLHSKIYSELSLTHLTDLKHARGGLSLEHDPVELTLTRRGYRNKENGFLADCTIYQIDGTGDVPIHLKAPEKTGIERLKSIYKLANSNSDNQKRNRIARGFLPVPLSYNF